MAGPVQEPDEGLLLLRLGHRRKNPIVLVNRESRKSGEHGVPRRSLETVDFLPIEGEFDILRQVCKPPDPIPGRPQR